MTVAACSQHVDVLEKHELRAIEKDDFPFEHLSEIAEMESWRKEINRPPYHIHKWWAQRLGSVFRAITIGAFATDCRAVMEAFYGRARFPDKVIFDPFMGSGTTVGEAIKCGARAIGRDINPVAYFGVLNALRPKSKKKMVAEFERLEERVARRIRHFYEVEYRGEKAEALYYFWVKQIPCPSCRRDFDLFSSYIFSRNAYPRKKPEAKSVCPQCGAINTVRYDTTAHDCCECGLRHNPSIGTVSGQKATCPHCNETFAVAKRVRELARPLSHRMYAKMVLTPRGDKEYQGISVADRRLYDEARTSLHMLADAIPVGAIEPGENTNQVLNYGYRNWYEMFNDRQLLVIHLLAEEIKQIVDPSVRELMVCLLTGTLEFNNMFASFKGEGTGAVRHMFAHHILKPERMPLEANIWGTRKSSGAFSTLFVSRLLRAIEYCDDPFELKLGKDGRGEKVFGLSVPMHCESASSYSEFQQGQVLYLSCGDSSATDIDTGSVDAVITDPPFFDNVHYSELADFFYVWQRHILGEAAYGAGLTTRSDGEVQHPNVDEFTRRITGVWRECHRVLRPNGLLMFTYHHSRVDGWASILTSLVDAGYRVVAAHPIKAEMSSAAPKQQAREPIDIDVIFVCRKRDGATHGDKLVVEEVVRSAKSQVGRLNGMGRRLSRNDVRVVVMAQLAKAISFRANCGSQCDAMLVEVVGGIEAKIEELFSDQQLSRQGDRQFEAAT